MKTIIICILIAVLVLLAAGVFFSRTDRSKTPGERIDQAIEQAGDAKESAKEQVHKGIDKL